MKRFNVFFQVKGEDIFGGMIMKTYRIVPQVIILLISFALVISGCGRRPTPRPAGSSIGTIELVTNTVHQNQKQVVGTNNLAQNDSVRLFGGGESLLNFGSDMILRLFNDTQLGGVRTSNAPGTPLVVKMTLLAGGFAGRTYKPGARPTFNTPNNAQINVFGTSFFIVYDPEQDLTTAGNFEGSMEIQAGGSEPTPIQSGFMRQAQGGDPPTPEVEIPFSMTEFEDMARQFQSPVAVVNEAVVVEAEPIDSEPPVIEVLQVEPNRLLVGPECPDSPNEVEVTYTLFEESEIYDTATEWDIGELSGTGPVKRIDDQTYISTVGPVDVTGTLIIFVEAVDEFGNFARSGPFPVEVVKCIG